MGINYLLVNQYVNSLQNVNNYLKLAIMIAKVLFNSNLMCSVAFDCNHSICGF